jgi:cell shape-determining protein MreC
MFMKTTYFKFRALQGVESDMGVINNLGLVGIVEDITYFECQISNK